MNRVTLASVGALVVLAVVYAKTREGHVAEGVQRLEVPAFDKAKIAELDFSGPQSAVLKRDGASWKVEDPAHPGAHPADDALANSAVDALGELKYLDLVTDRKARHGELEVDDAKGLHVKVVAEGKPALELVFGKATRGGTYVRKAGQSAVFLCQGRFPALGRRAAKDWRRHALLSLSADDITRLEVRPRSGSGYALDKGADGAWAPAKGTVLPTGFRFDPAAGQRLAQQVASLSAQDFMDQPLPDETLGLAGAHDVIEAQLKAGKTVVANLGLHVETSADGGVTAAPTGNGLVALRVDGDPQTYLLAQYTATQLTQPLSSMRDLSLLSFDVSKVKTLTIHGAKPVTVKKDGEAWRLVEPKKLPAGIDFDPAQVPVQLSRLRGVRAARLEETALPDAKTGLNKPASTIEVTLEDGTRQSLRFGKDVPGHTPAVEVYAKGGADKALYVMTLFEKNRFDTGPDLFKKPPAPNFGGPGGGMRGLEQLPPEVRRQLEAQLRQRAGGMQ